MQFKLTQVILVVLRVFFMLRLWLCSLRTKMHFKQTLVRTKSIAFRVKLTVVFQKSVEVRSLTVTDILNFLIWLVLSLTRNLSNVIIITRWMWWHLENLENFVNRSKVAFCCRSRKNMPGGRWAYDFTRHYWRPLYSVSLQGKYFLNSLYSRSKIVSPITLATSWVFAFLCSLMQVMNSAVVQIKHVSTLPKLPMYSWF